MHLMQCEKYTTASLLLSMIAMLFFTICGVRGEIVEVPRFLPSLGDAEPAPEPTAIRFVTSDDFPPLNFIDGGGRLTGFNVELARLLCTRMAIPCTIQVRPFPLLVQTLEDNQADAIVAGIADTPGLRSYLSYSQPYLRIPARFVARRPAATDLVPETLVGRTIAVVAGTRYADFLLDFFPSTRLIETKEYGDALALVRDGAADAAFGSALSAAFWMSGPEAQDCCAFASGAFTEPSYFGMGMSIAVSAENEPLRAAIDETLRSLETDGSIADLYLRFFPLGLY